MFKFNRLVCALGICMVVGVAYAAAVKVKGLTPVGLDLMENPDRDGMAITNFHPGDNRTEVTAAITDFLPDTLYNILVAPGIQFPVVTNGAGNANVHGFYFFEACAVGGVTHICMFVWRDDDINGFRAGTDEVSPGPEDRAWGCTPCP